MRLYSFTPPSSSTSLDQELRWLTLCCPSMPKRPVFGDINGGGMSDDLNVVVCGFCPCFCSRTYSFAKRAAWSGPPLSLWSFLHQDTWIKMVLDRKSAGQKRFAVCVRTVSKECASLCSLCPQVRRSLQISQRTGGRTRCQSQGVHQRLHQELWRRHGR